MFEELNYFEMGNLHGGVSRTEYCAQLKELLDGDYAKNVWTREQWYAAWSAYSKHCADNGGGNQGGSSQIAD